MEIPINPNAILGFLLFFAVAYFFAWMLLVKNWLVKIFGVIGGLKLLELALGTNSYIIVISILLAYIVAFREVLLRWVQSLIEWFFIIKEHLEAVIRIILYPFIYAYKFLFTGLAHVREEVNNSSNPSGSNNTWQDEEVNRAREEAYHQSQKSDEARRKAEREKERYKEEARKAREEARKQEENNNSDSGFSSSDRKSKTDNRTPMEVLGLNPGFTQAELKKAYKSAASRYHPDKYAHMSEELQAEMAEEFKKVQGAYNKLLNKV